MKKANREEALRKAEKERIKSKKETELKEKVNRKKKKETLEGHWEMIRWLYKCIEEHKNE